MHIKVILYDIFMLWKTRDQNETMRLKNVEGFCLLVMKENSILSQVLLVFIVVQRYFREGVSNIRTGREEWRPAGGVDRDCNGVARVAEGDNYTRNDNCLSARAPGIALDTGSICENEECVCPSVIMRGFVNAAAIKGRCLLQKAM